MRDRQISERVVGNTGCLLVLLQETDPAADVFETLVGERRCGPEVFNNFGYVLARQGRYTEAAEMCTLAVQAKPNDMRFVKNLLVVLVLSGKVEEACDTLETLVARLGKESGLAYLYARVLEYRSCFAEALAVYRACLSITPPAGRVWLGIARCLRRLGRLDGAREARKIARRLADAENDSWGGKGCPSLGASADTPASATGFEYGCLGDKVKSAGRLSGRRFLLAREITQQLSEVMCRGETTSDWGESGGLASPASPCSCT